MATHPRSTCPVRTCGSSPGTCNGVAANEALGGAGYRCTASLGIGVATAYRYIREAVDLLAALAPKLADAIRQARRIAFVILDGTLLPIDRIAADRPFCSGKHRKHGMNVQVLADPLGRLLWASPALPGAVHDLKAARAHGIIEALTAADIRCWADKGYRAAPAAPCVCPTGGGGRISPQASRRPTAHTPGSGP